MKTNQYVKLSFGLLASAAACLSAATGQARPQSSVRTKSASVNGVARRSAFASSSRLRTCLPQNLATPFALVGGTITFTAVASGDAGANDAIVWTHVDQSGAVNLMAQVSTDATFQAGGLTFLGTTDPNRDNILKIHAIGLQAGVRYYYRFVGPVGELSSVGTFKTAPAPTAQVPVHFGFSGDADGQWRPYDSVWNFTAPGVLSFSQQSFDYFVWLGDTIYETASKGSPAAANPFTNPTQALADYHRKYREQLIPVNPGGVPNLHDFFSSTGHYTLLDNHETGNKQFQAGGAPTGTPPGAGVDPTNPTNDVNTTGSYMNQTVGFQTLVRAYSDYQPIAEMTVNAPTDPRSNGVQQLYFFRQWGPNCIFFDLDDRSYRDIRMKTATGADDTGPRAANPNRTMLGQTQLQWFEQSLLAAQAHGITWKVVAVSSPIDQIGAIGSGADGGKSWLGGYRAERNAIFKFIADNHIDHVVFLSTDDHQVRINELTYQTVTDVQSSSVLVPGAFEVVAGPIGAGGPDAVTDHSFGNVKSLADTLAGQESAAGVNPIGLDPAFPGLHNVFREGDSNADALRQPVDFYSPDTFNWATLDVSADGRTLTVSLFGINSYVANTFPEPSALNPVHKVLSFQVTAQIPGFPKIVRSGFVFNRRTQTFAQQVTVTNNSANPIVGPVYLVLDNLSANATLTNKTGNVTHVAPFGSPYITVPGTAAGLAPGASATVTLQFSNATNGGITFTTRELDGTAAP